MVLYAVRRDGTGGKEWHVDHRLGALQGDLRKAAIGMQEIILHIDDDQR